VTASGLSGIGQRAQELEEKNGRGHSLQRRDLPGPGRKRGLCYTARRKVRHASATRGRGQIKGCQAESRWGGKQWSEGQTVELNTKRRQGTDQGMKSPRPKKSCSSVAGSVSVTPKRLLKGASWRGIPYRRERSMGGVTEKGSRDKDCKGAMVARGLTALLKTRG